MTDSPYRSPASPEGSGNEDDAAAKVAAEEAKALGSLRSVHGPRPRAFLRALFPAILVAAILGSVLLTNGLATNTRVLGLVIAFVVALGLVLVLKPILHRRVHVALHAGGLTVIGGVGRAGCGREVIVFGDVDQVWLELDVTRTSLGSIALIRGIRLVGHDGTNHHVPVNLERGEEITQWVLRHCSEPLRADARAALQAGEELTFGDVRIDRDGVRGPSWGARWDEIRLVRFIPGSVALFRGQEVFPWRTIELESVPHPTVFSGLVAECARRTEVDGGVASSWV